MKTKRVYPLLDVEPHPTDPDARLLMLGSGGNVVIDASVAEDVRRWRWRAYAYSSGMGGWKISAMVWGHTLQELSNYLWEDVWGGALKPRQRLRFLDGDRTNLRRANLAL